MNHMLGYAASILPVLAQKWPRPLERTTGTAGLTIILHLAVAFLDACFEDCKLLAFDFAHALLGDCG